MQLGIIKVSYGLVTPARLLLSVFLQFHDCNNEFTAMTKDVPDLLAAKEIHYDENNQRVSVESNEFVARYTALNQWKTGSGDRRFQIFSRIIFLRILVRLSFSQTRISSDYPQEREELSLGKRLIQGLDRTGYLIEISFAVSVLRSRRAKIDV